VILVLAIAGLFTQDCASGFRRSQDFRGDRVIYSEENFFDPACAEPSVASRSYGSYSLGGPAGEAREIDFVFERVTLEPKTEAVAASYRARALCGITGWEKDRETEITGLACDFLGNGGNFSVPAAGDIRYGIVREEERGLRFGRLSPEFNGSSPERRPRFLDPVPYLRKAD
jgi:hypothetical protein